MHNVAPGRLGADWHSTYLQTGTARISRVRDRASSVWHVELGAITSRLELGAITSRPAM